MRVDVNQFVTDMCVEGEDWFRQNKNPDKIGVFHKT